jgi:metal-responsive CopG/Arc/MetJ family transcriptional regulator
MPNITLSLPDDIYKKMKKYSEIKWSEVVRKAIADYIKKLEESRMEITTGELLDDLGNDFKKSLDELEFEKAVEGYEKMRDAEWKRTSMTQVN